MACRLFRAVEKPYSGLVGGGGATSKATRQSTMGRVERGEVKTETGERKTQNVEYRGETRERREQNTVHRMESGEWGAQGGEWRVESRVRRRKSESVEQIQRLLPHMQNAESRS